MPQPWGTLHAAWIKTMGNQSASAAAGVIVPGSCRSGITTVLGSSLRMQGYYRLAISSNDDAGAPERWQRDGDGDGEWVGGRKTEPEMGHGMRKRRKTC
jgi:hypothetical protein